MSEKANFYDEEIAPKLSELADACYERGRSFVAGVSNGELDGMAFVSSLTEDARIGITSLALLAQLAPDIDKFIFSLIKHCKENNIDTKSSGFLTACISFMEFMEFMEGK